MANEVWVPAVEAVIEVGSSYFAHRLSANVSITTADRIPDIAVVAVTRRSQIRTSALKFKSFFWGGGDGGVALMGYPAATTSMDAIKRPQSPYLAEVEWRRHVRK